MATDKPDLTDPDFEPTDAQLEGLMKGFIASVRRREAVHQAVASARIEGQEPTPETRAILDELAAGRIDEEGMMRRILDQ